MLHLGRRKAAAVPEGPAEGCGLHPEADGLNTTYLGVCPLFNLSSFLVHFVSEH